MEDLLERGKGTATPLGVGWPNRENPRKRVSPNSCGLSRTMGRNSPSNAPGLPGSPILYGYIRANELPMKAYRGYDLSEKMLEVARERVGPDAELIRSNHLTESADCSVRLWNLQHASGGDRRGVAGIHEVSDP